MRMIRRIELAIYRWLARRHERRNLAKAAQAILKAEDPTPLAKANAEAIIAAIKDRRPVCCQCLLPYEYRQRPWTDYVRLRAILMIPDSQPDPMICDACFETAICAFNPQATNVGTRNDGQPNLALRLLGNS